MAKLADIPFVQVPDLPPAATGIAYTGPTAVNLREDLGPRATVVATLQHGERLEVLETRRRFVRVRTSTGLEGWTDANYLLSQQQVSDLDKLAEFAAKLPSQGKGTTFDSLNVHTAPSRQAPSFTQIPEGGAADVAGASAIATECGDAACGGPCEERRVRPRTRTRLKRTNRPSRGKRRHRHRRRRLLRLLPTGWNCRVRCANGSGCRTGCGPGGRPRAH